MDPPGDEEPPPSSPLVELVNERVLNKKRAAGRPKGSVAKAPGTKKVKVKDETKNKAPNFHEDEDELVSHAYINRSENSLAGVSKKSKVFWEDVTARYAILQEKSTSEHTKHERTWNMLKGRFLRQIQPAVSAFNRYYKKAKDTIPSGHPDIEEAIMEMARELWQENHPKGHKFKFSLCVPILHKLPKFDPMGAAGLDSDDDDDKEQVDAGGVNRVGSGGVNRVGSVVGSHLQRPIGSKAAKANKKEVDNNTQRVLEMRGDFTLYVSQARRREEFLEMIELAKYYRSIGDREMARQTNIDLQALIARNRLAREEEKKKEEASKSTSSTSPDESTAVTTVPSVIDLGTNQERDRGASLTGIELPPDDSSSSSVFTPDAPPDVEQFPITDDADDVAKTNVI